MEGHLEDIKENENFWHFNYRSEEKVYKNSCCMRLAGIS